MNERDRADLQRWLDGSLDAQDRTTFERRLAAEPELRAELALHEQVATSLRRSFAVPKITTPRLPPPSIGPAPGPTALRRWWLPFAIGLATAAGVLLAWSRPWSPRTAPSPAPETLAILRTAVGRSWLAVCDQQEAVAPLQSCTPPDQLPNYVGSLTPTLPSPLLWREQPDVVFERGLESTPHDGLRVLALVVLPGTRVFLFVVPAATDPQPTLPADSDWRLFRESRGPLVVYELTSLAEPRGLPCVMQSR